MRCDECASLNGYADVLRDADVSKLPAAIDAQIASLPNSAGARRKRT